MTQITLESFNTPNVNLNFNFSVSHLTLLSFQSSTIIQLPSSLVDEKDEVTVFEFPEDTPVIGILNTEPIRVII